MAPDRELATAGTRSPRHPPSARSSGSRHRTDRSDPSTNPRRPLTKKNVPRGRIISIFVVIAFVYAVLGARLFDIQVSQKDKYKEVGLAQAQKEAQEGGLQAMLDQATASERMEASMGKFSELSNSIGSIFAPIVDMFAAVAGWLAQSEVAMIIISGVISGLGALLAVLGVKAALLAVKSVITAVASIFTGSASLGPFGIPLAIAGVGALVGGIAAATAVGDVNSPSIGKTQISTKEGGLLELSKNDDLIASPGASKMMQGGQPTQTVQNNTVVENKTDMSATNALLAQLIKKTPEMAPLGMYELQ